MTVEIRPYGDKCNLRCQYCYENPLRDFNLPSTSPDWDAIKKALIEQDRQFIIFGGEPLVTPIEELEEIWKLGKEKWGQNGIQTNGTAITNQHIALFKKYNVHVGFSIDGPHMLNDARSAPSGELNATRRLTELANKNLILCLKEGIGTSLIVTMTRHNNNPDKLIPWLVKLEQYGLEHVRIHLMEQDGNVSHLIPTEDRLLEHLIMLYELQKITNLKFDLIYELVERLKTSRGGTCIFQECDPCNTRAVHGIGVKGEVTNCGRINKEGIDFLKAADYLPIRSYVLQATPQTEGGCKGCGFWYACKGNCPGTGLRGDWRNRTTHCSILKRLMEFLVEAEGIEIPKSGYCSDPNCDHLDEHGDNYTDTAHIDTPHIDTPHIDNPHIDNAHIDKTYLPRLEVRS
jgi:uncharacterized protein